MGGRDQTPTGPVEVWAAGGVVWRPGWGECIEVLLVHRPRYDDWSLPKGKRDPGETDEACAQREVAEETGLDCPLGAELAETHYVDRKGRHKAVRWWAMAAPEDAAPVLPVEEVDRVCWLTVAGARALTTYADDRLVLDAFEAAVGAA